MAEKLTTLEIGNIVSEFEGIQNEDGTFTLPNGAEIAVSTMRIYVTNPAECLTDSDYEGDFLTRKTDGAEGIKFLKSTSREDIFNLIGHVAGIELSEPDNSESDESETPASVEEVEAKLADLDNDESADSEKEAVNS